MFSCSICIVKASYTLYLPSREPETSVDVLCVDQWQNRSQNQKHCDGLLCFWKFISLLFQATSLRLVSGEDRCSARVEVSYTGSWGTFVMLAGIQKTQRLCAGSLGVDWLCQPELVPLGVEAQEVTSWMMCSARGRNLWEYYHRGWHRHNCGHQENASVICSGTSMGFGSDPT